MWWWLWWCVWRRVLVEASVFLMRLSKIMIHSSSSDHNESRWLIYESSSSLVLMGVTMVVEEVEVEVAAVWPELTVVLELIVSVDLRDMSEVMEVVDVLDKDRSSLDGGRSWQPMDAKLSVAE